MAMMQCKHCQSRCAQTKEAVSALREACNEGVACGLRRVNINLLPSRPIITVPNHTKTPVAALLSSSEKVIVLPQPSHKVTPKPASQETVTIEIPDPLYILIKSSRRVKIINKE